MIKQAVLLLTLFPLLFACSAPPEKLGELDLVQWRKDRSACGDVRAKLVENFKSEEKQLLGKFADDVGNLLGKPDIHQLAGRNQKIYIYFLEKGTQCDDITQPSTAMKAVLRFNAIGLLTEITYQQEIPE
jgi:hypothetical protein